MLGFPSYDTLAVGLLALLVGWALGDSWGRRQERDTLERRWEQEAHRVLRGSSQWHQQPVTVTPLSTRGRPHGVHSAPSPGMGDTEGDGG